MTLTSKELIEKALQSVTTVQQIAPLPTSEQYLKQYMQKCMDQQVEALKRPALQGFLGGLGGYKPNDFAAIYGKGAKDIFPPLPKVSKHAALRALDAEAGLKPLRPHNDDRAAERKAQQEAEERRKGERDKTLAKGLRRAFG